MKTKQSNPFVFKGNCHDLGGGEGEWGSDSKIWAEAQGRRRTEAGTEDVVVFRF